MREYTKTIIRGEFAPTDSGSAIFTGYDPKLGRDTVRLIMQAEIDENDYPSGAEIIQVFKAALKETLDHCGYKIQHSNIKERRALQAMYDTMCDAQDAFEVQHEAI